MLYISRPLRTFTALLLLISMLIMQQAKAAYVCPMALAEQQSTSEVKAANDDDMMDMANCAGRDIEAPTLCQASDISESSSLDKPVAPPVLPFQQSSLYSIIKPKAPQGALSHRREDVISTWGSLSGLLLSIRNCRFLI